MITRVWRGWAPADRAQVYEQHAPRSCRAAGRDRVRGRTPATAATGDETEFMSLTFFDTLDRAFAGRHYETAVVAAEAREVLVRFDDHVGHYETAFKTS